MNTTDLATCQCYCGHEVSPKATYRPGHDARHVSNLLQTIINHQAFDKVAEYQTDLPSIALRTKLAKAVENHLARQAKKAPASKPETVEKPNRFHARIVELEVDGERGFHVFANASAEGRFVNKVNAERIRYVGNTENVTRH